MTHMTFSAKEALESYSNFEKQVVYTKRNVMTIDDIALNDETFDKLDAANLIYVVVDNVKDELVAFSTREEAEAYQYGEKSEDQKVLDKVLEGPATDNLDAMKEAFEEAREEVKEEETETVEKVKRAKPYSRAHMIEYANFTSDDKVVHDAYQFYFADFPRRKICAVLVRPVSSFRSTDKDFVFYKIHRTRGILSRKVSGRYQLTERGDIRFIY